MISDRYLSQPSGRKVRQFTLNSKFIAQFEGKQPDWGPVGYFTYKRTYSRPTCGCNDYQ
jgi:hypothetical protein